MSSDVYECSFSGACTRPCLKKKYSLRKIEKKGGRASEYSLEHQNMSFLHGQKNIPLYENFHANIEFSDVYMNFYSYGFTAGHIT
jgi:hypothetical protein